MKLEGCGLTGGPGMLLYTKTGLRCDRSGPQGAYQLCALIALCLKYVLWARGCQQPLQVGGSFMLVWPAACLDASSGSSWM